MSLPQTEYFSISNFLHKLTRPTTVYIRSKIDWFQGVWIAHCVIFIYTDKGAISLGSHTHNALESERPYKLYTRTGPGS